MWLALAAGLTVLIVPLPRRLVQAEEILALIVFAGAALFVYLVFRKEQELASGKSTSAGGTGPLRWLSTTLGKLAAGLRDIGRSRRLYGSFGASALLLLFQILAFWLVMRACGLRLSFWRGVAVLLILHLGTAIPGAPSNVGTYQFFVVAGLTLFGVDKTAAASFSVVVFLILTIPLWAIGALAFGRAGLSLRHIRSKVPALAERCGDGAGAPRTHRASDLVFRPQLQCLGSSKRN